MLPGQTQDAAASGEAERVRHRRRCVRRRSTLRRCSSSRALFCGIEIGRNLVEAAEPQRIDGAADAGIRIVWPQFDRAVAIRIGPFEIGLVMAGHAALLIRGAATGHERDRAVGGLLGGRVIAERIFGIAELVPGQCMRGIKVIALPLIIVLLELTPDLVLLDIQMPGRAGSRSPPRSASRARR